ncbi:alpha/beta hydrolase [Delftia sp.]|uniref:alpha/beta hydrolase n=1 Tax=Delftia sp. TaxID=1886637 RepID=UPI00259CE865|nr:alpha/beta hydrolase [Delftia sp.]
MINDLDYVPAKDGARSCYWLQRGYALSGTGRNPQRNFNYDPDREQQELISVIDMFNARLWEAYEKVIQYGHSGGGFVALNFAERYPEKVDGVVIGCAHEPVPLMNMMLDGWFVLKTLIASELQVVGFSDLASVADQSAKWRAALTLAQQSQEGRARIALAAAVGQWPVWSNATRAQPDPFDLGALQVQSSTLCFSTPPNLEDSLDSCLSMQGHLRQFGNSLGMRASTTPNFWPAPSRQSGVWCYRFTRQMDSISRPILQHCGTRPVYRRNPPPRRSGTGRDDQSTAHPRYLPCGCIQQEITWCLQTSSIRMFRRCRPMVEM